MSSFLSSGFFETHEGKYFDGFGSERRVLLQPRILEEAETIRNVVLGVDTTQINFDPVNSVGIESIKKRNSIKLPIEPRKVLDWLATHHPLFQRVGFSFEKKLLYPHKGFKPFDAQDCTSDDFRTVVCDVPAFRDLEKRAKLNQLTTKGSRVVLRAVGQDLNF